MLNKARCYPYRFSTEEDLVTAALAVMESRLKRYDGAALKCPDDVRRFLKMKLAHLEHECFFTLFLTSQHRLIEAKEMFRGTIDGASVWPREVVKEALACNAAAVAFCHNHPGGSRDPSRADLQITERLEEAMELFDITVVDHFIVASDGHVSSFSEQGLLKRQRR